MAQHEERDVAMPHPTKRRWEPPVVVPLSDSDHGLADNCYSGTSAIGMCGNGGAPLGMCENGTVPM